jgi:Domain of unknown function (DUF5979)
MVIRQHFLRRVANLAAVALAVSSGMSSSSVVLSAADAQSNTPVVAITVVHTIRGAERTPQFAYRFELNCVRANGTTVDPVVAFSIVGADRRTFTVADVPGLTATDVCSVRTIDNNGAESTYATTVPKRADGSQPEPIPGIITPRGYASAPAAADGRTISIVSTFGGDLTVTHRVVGAPSAGVPAAEIRVSCDGGYARSVLLRDAQQQILTGIPAGSVCRVTRPGGMIPARFDDNSGVPSDGVVTIVATSPTCWDLRNAAPECRAAVTIFSQYEAPVTDVASEPVSTTVQPTTTIDQSQQRNDPSVIPVAGPAPIAEPPVADASDATVG